MKKTFIATLALILSIAITSCGPDIKEGHYDFTTKENAGRSYFELIKYMNADTMKNYIINQEDMVAINKVNDGFKNDLIRQFGEAEDAQYKGILDETMGRFNRLYNQMVKTHHLTPEMMKDVSGYNAVIEDNNFNGLELARYKLEFEAGGKPYFIMMTTVHVNDKWKAVDFQDIIPR